MTNPTTQVTFIDADNPEIDGATGFIRNDAILGYAISPTDSVGQYPGKTLLLIEHFGWFKAIQEPPEVIMAAMVQAAEARRG